MSCLLKFFSINTFETPDKEKSVFRRFKEQISNETTKRLSRFSFLLFFNSLKINFINFLDYPINTSNTLPKLQQYFVAVNCTMEDFDVVFFRNIRESTNTSTDYNVSGRILYFKRIGSPF